MSRYRPGIRHGDPVLPAEPRSDEPRTAAGHHAVMFPKPPPDEVRQLIASIERRLRLIDASIETVAQAMLDARIGVEGDTPEDQWMHTVYYAGQFLQALNERLGVEAEAAGRHDPEAVRLDMERLAQAWHMTQRCVHGKGSGEPMQTVGYLNPDREVARDILDEYAALARTATDGSSGMPAQGYPEGWDETQLWSDPRPTDGSSA